MTPIASPDNYFDEVLALVKGAEHEILIQNQTFNAPKGGESARPADTARITWKDYMEMFG